MENITVKPRGKAGRPKKEKPNEEVKPKIKLFDRHKYARNQKLQEDDTDDEDIIINLNEEEKEVKVLEVRRKKKRPERVRAGTKAPPRPTDAERAKPDAKEEPKPDAKEEPETKQVIDYTSTGESGNLSDSSKMRQKLMIRHYSANYGNPYNKFNPNQQYLIF
jgi:hypothetical protein